MKRAITRLFSKISSSDTSTTMSPGRFFVNSMSDLAQGELVKPLTEAVVKPTLNEMVNKITTKYKATLRNAEDGLYLGTAGIAYMFYHLSKIDALKEHREIYLQQAVDYIKPALELCLKKHVQKSDLPSFLLGNAGIYAIAAAIFNTQLDFSESTKNLNLYIEAGKICKNIEFLSCGSDELFVGRAGYLCGALWLQRELGHNFNQDDLYELCRVTVESGRNYAQRYNFPTPLMYSYYNVEYLGAGHGLASILFYVISVPGYIEANPKDARDIRASIDYLLSLQDSEGNFPTAMDEINSAHNELVHWCHGAGGTAYLFAKAYQIWNDQKYLDGIKRSADLIWKKGLLKKGPGLCHGIAGNGYVFLLLYRLTHDLKYLHRANCFFHFMYNDEFQKKARTPDNPYSLYEGLAGTACYVGDLLNPEKSEFPFCDIFS
ncbi:lanC-like protein 3 homolog [Onthophagus taurus]|uniref:lanC-like protein 3 homolog n=1 Tax=Onthophagus taurus TaxID=166361 RepID=UPI000C20991C|nr:lanC-like protein 3 homolog [Onthophagus taurus]